jgi:hypothetical protein
MMTELLISEEPIQRPGNEWQAQQAEMQAIAQVVDGGYGCERQSHTVTGSVRVVPCRWESGASDQWDCRITATGIVADATNRM